MFTISDKLKELRRELALRRKVYPGFIARGMLKKDDSAWQIAIMEAIITDYERLAKIEPGDSLFDAAAKDEGFNFDGRPPAVRPMATSGKPPPAAGWSGLRKRREWVPVTRRRDAPFRGELP